MNELTTAMGSLNTGIYRHVSSASRTALNSDCMHNVVLPEPAVPFTSMVDGRTNPPRNISSIPGIPVITLFIIHLHLSNPLHQFSMECVSVQSIYALFAYIYVVPE